MNPELSRAHLNIEGIAQRVLQDLEKGVSPWEKPWFCIPSINGLSGNAYRGLNYVHLALMREDYQFSSSIWVTFKQAQQLRGRIKKNSKGFKISYYDTREKSKVNPRTGEIEVDVFFILKFAVVFNLDQTEGLEFLRTQYERHPEVILNEKVQPLIQASGAHIVHAAIEGAYFKPVEDEIVLPNPGFFKSEPYYYSTLFHELIHWTGAANRLHRDFSGRFGEEAYAFEELVAELGASLLCAHIGLAYSTQHSAYIAAWIKVLKNDPKALLTAAHKAQQAVDHLLKLQMESPAQEVA